MDSYPSIGYADGASQSQATSVAWVIFSPTNELVSFGGISLGTVTNNIVEYNVVIGLLSEAINLGIRHLVVRLDSHFVVRQLNRVYFV